MKSHEESKATPKTTNISLNVPLSREFDVFLNEYLDAKDDQAREKIFNKFLGKIQITTGHGWIQNYLRTKAKDKVTKTCVKKLTDQEQLLIEILKNLQHSEAAKYYVVFVLNLFAKKTSKDQKNPKDFANLPFVKKLASPLFKIFSDLLCARPFIGLTDEQMQQHNTLYSTEYTQGSILTPAELENIKKKGYEVKRSQLEAPEVAQLVLENYQKAQEVRFKLKRLLNLYNNIRPFAGEEGLSAYEKLKSFANDQAETSTSHDNNADEAGAAVDADSKKLMETKALAQNLLQRASQASEPAQVELKPREVEQYRQILEKIGIDMPETKELTEEDVLGIVGFQNQNKALTDLVQFLDWLISKPDLLKIMHKRQATILEIVAKFKKGSKGGANAAKGKVGSIDPADSDSLCRNLTAFFELYDLTQGNSKPKQDNSSESKINYNFKFENYKKVQNSWHVITNVLLFVYLIGLSCFYIFMNLSLACTLVCFGSFLFVGALLNWAFMVKPKVFYMQVDIFQKRASEHPSFTQFREIVKKNHIRLNPKLQAEFLFLAKALHSDGFVPLTEVRALAKAMGFEHSASVSYAYLWFTANNANIAFAPKKPKAANIDNAEAGAVAVDIGVPEDGKSARIKAKIKPFETVKTSSLLYIMLFKSKSFRTLSSLKLFSKVKTLKPQFSFDPNTLFGSLQESINDLCQDYPKDAVAKDVEDIKEIGNIESTAAKASLKFYRERLITKNYRENALSNAYNSLNNFHSHWLLLILFAVLAVGSSIAYAFRTTVHYGFLMIALLFVGAASIVFIKQGTVSAARLNFKKACRKERDSIIEVVMKNNAPPESSVASSAAN